jgi:hypothetical protein
MEFQAAWNGIVKATDWAWEHNYIPDPSHSLGAHSVNAATRPTGLSVSAGEVMPGPQSSARGTVIWYLKS